MRKLKIESSMTNMDVRDWEVYIENQSIGQLIKDNIEHGEYLKQN